MRSRERRTSSASPARFRTAAASARTCIAGGCGRCANTPASRPPRNRTRATAICSSAARPGSRSRSTCRRSSAYDSDAPLARGEVGKVGVAIDSIADMETLLDGHTARSRHGLDDDQRAGRDSARAAARRRAAARHSVRQARRNGAERRAQRVRRARHLHLSAETLDASWSPT